MMSLGGFAFRVRQAPVDEIERAAAWRWEPMERIGAAPAWQFVGPAEQTIVLTGVTFPAVSGFPDPAEAMREEAGRGEPLRMMDGTGRILGMWTVRRIEERRTALIDTGSPRRVEYRLELALHTPASGSPRRRIAVEDSGIVEGGRAQEDFERIELMPAEIRSELAERVSKVDRARALARKGLSLREALEREAGSQAGELYDQLDRAGLGDVARRLWGPSELLALAPRVPRIPGASNLRGI